MPFFSPKTWKQRIVEFPGRRRLDDTSSADVYDVSRAEGTVTQEGDGFTAANMNDLEQRINNAVNDVAGLSADEYDPNATYSSGDLRIHDNILHKAKQDISVAEPWTPGHWDPTTLAAELSAVNSRSPAPDYKNKQIISGDSYTAVADGYVRISSYLGNTQVAQGNTVQVHVTINGEEVYHFLLYLTSSDMYISCDSGPIPVKKGDNIIFGHLGNDNPNRIFYPVRL